MTGQTTPLQAGLEGTRACENTFAFAVKAEHPVSPGHTLIVTRREVSTWFAASPEEQRAIFDLVAEVRASYAAGIPWPDGTTRVPEGCSVGFYAEAAPGQIGKQLHVHVIPQYRDELHGSGAGVHSVFSERESVHSAREAPFTRGGTEDPLLPRVQSAFAMADEIRVVAAFVQQSGLDVISGAVNGALARGADVRILTGDYLDITQASALTRLLDWQSARKATQETHLTSNDVASEGTFEARVIETRLGRWKGHAFHPKAWLFQAGTHSVAFVGSSNISRSALTHGVEWNLGVEANEDAATFARLWASFEDIWHTATPLTETWVAAYAERARAEAIPLPNGELEAEALPALPEPRDVQLEALEALARAREDGAREALVVLATGLGKTLLAILDFAAFAEGRTEEPRLMFMAHRQEILEQAAEQVRRFAAKHGRVAKIGWCIGDSGDLDAPIVFASVAKLARPRTLARLRGQHFGYMVVDEVHHAAAESYRRVLDAVSYDFLLGLTATPERADGQEYLSLFGGRERYRADIGRGIALGHLVSFAYYGVRDDIDYAHIPWRNRRFDPSTLAQAAQTEARMESLLRAWRAHPGKRTLVFCCSIEHARYVRVRLATEGIRTAVVYAGKGSDDRAEALRALRSGELDAICAVDVFNEGVDVREIDRVVLLRPTESRVIFLQQLGRGLRTHESKERLVIIDFVGNHRVFADRLRALFSLGSGGDPVLALRHYVERGEAPELPSGCSVELELEAKALLEQFVLPRSTDATLAAYEELRARLGRRPTAKELLRSGHSVALLRASYGGWFNFVQAQGDLDDWEKEALSTCGPLFKEMETTEAKKALKWVALEAFVKLDGFVAGGVTVESLAAESRRILMNHPELLADIPENKRPDGGDGNILMFLNFWTENPVSTLAGTKRGTVPHFILRDGRLQPRVDVRDEVLETLGAMVRELVDMRLAAWSQREANRAELFRCKVIRDPSNEPILKFASRGESAGTRDVRLPNGDLWLFGFAKDSSRTARPYGAPRNRLGDLLRGWFGPSAGESGREHVVRFYKSPDGLWVEPESVIDLAEVRSRGRVVTYPDLRAAAGYASGSALHLAAEEATLSSDGLPRDVFAVRVNGTSMDGGSSPLRHGDWAVLRPARGDSSSELEGRVVLAEVPDGGDGFAYQLKRLMRTERGWMFRSDNPEGPQIPAREPMKVIARLEATIRPEDLAPPVGTLIAEDALAAAFGFEQVPARTGRSEGHLFVFLLETGSLRSPTEVMAPEVDERPGETAFVFARRSDGRWRYLGVGRRPAGTEGQPFRIPEVDGETWRTLGPPCSSVSWSLADDALRFAQRIVDASLEGEKPIGILRTDGARGFVRGRAVGGGITADGGPGGFAPCTVTLTDLAWVVMAVRDVLDHGGTLDLARVHRIRAREGTPMESPSGNESGWALAVYEAVRDQVGLLRREINGPIRVREGATEIDATYSRVREGTEEWIFFGSRGGTVGSGEARNTDYSRGLEILLGQLRTEGAILRDVLVETTRTDDLAVDERRVPIEGYAYPVTIDDPARLRSAISVGQVSIGQKNGAKGGNSTRRLRIVLGKSS